jgi:MFS family permease
MVKGLLALAAIIAGTMVLQVANGILGIIVPLQMGLSGKPTAVIGMVVTAYALGFLIGCLGAPGFVRPVGHIRAFAALAATMSVTALLFTVTDSGLVWAVLRFASGLCLAALFTVIESWITGEAPREGRGRVIAVYMVCNKAGVMAGQGLLALGDAASAGFFVFVCGCFSFSLVPVALTRAAGPVPQDAVRLGLRALYRIAPIGIVGCLGAGLVNAPVLGLAPVYGLKVGLAPERIAVLVLVAQLGSVLAQWPLGWLSDRIDRRQVIVAATAVSAAASLAIALFGREDARLLLALFAVWGAFSLSIYAVCIAHASDFAKPAELLPLISSLLVAWAIGSAIGPPLATFAMMRAGEDALFTYAAVVTALIGAFAAWRMTRRRAVPPAEREAFVNLPATSPAVAELSPRVEREAQPEDRRA